MADKELYQTAEQVLASKAVKKDEKEKKVNEEKVSADRDAVAGFLSIQES